MGYAASNVPADSDIEDFNSDPNGSLLNIAIDDVEPNVYQPRKSFDEESLDALANSIRSLGVLQPLLVRQKAESDKFELIAGERRWRAAKRAGLAVVPVIVKQVQDLTSLEQAIVENLHRADLNPLEEAVAYQQLVEDFGLTQAEVAARTGKGRSAIANTLRLLQLPVAIQRRLRAGELSAGHAKALLMLESSTQQLSLADYIVESGCSVRQAEAEARKIAGGGSSSSGSSQTKAPNPAKRPPGYLEVERQLSDVLQTSVEIVASKDRGRLVIDFADSADLARIYEILRLNQ